MNPAYPPLSTADELMRRTYPNQEWTTADLCYQCASIDLEDFKTWLEKRFHNHGCPMCYFILDCADLQDNSGQTFVSKGPSIRGNRSLYAIEATYFPPGGGLTCNAYVSTLVGTPSPASLLPLRRVAPDSIDYTLIKEWITWCQDTHSTSCGLQTREAGERLAGLSSFKVIDCSLKKVISAPAGCEYVALSYVWGPETSHPVSDLQPSSSKFTACHDASLPENLPETIADAILVALALGMKYLWVDKYCINQSDSEEMDTQISVMDIIYESAYVTIVAGEGSAISGLPGVTKTPRLPQPSISINGKTWLSSLHGWDLFRASPWSSRAWYESPL
jgi:hypothetical protein